MNEHVTVTGAVQIKLCDEFGNIKQEFDTHNLVVTSGKEFIASRMGGTALGVISHIGVGTGTTAPALADTALQTQLVRETTTTAISGADITYSATLAPTVGTGTLAEAGLFNASTGGIMLSRVTFPTFLKAAVDTLYIVWTITIK